MGNPHDFACNVVDAFAQQPRWPCAPRPRSIPPVFFRICMSCCNAAHSSRTVQAVLPPAFFRT
jgi:hypothetical protein